MSDPFALFKAWFADAQSESEPHAMALATEHEGQPSVRMTLLRSFDERGFVFYTNYQSRKGSELAMNPRAAILFYWHPLHRQVRIEGRVERTTPEESDAYFAGRERAKQLSAWASDQSQEIESRVALIERLQKVEKEFEGRHVPRPPHWGGYRLIPDAFEFWQGYPDRLHDRTLFVLQDGEWRTSVLMP